MSVDNTKKQTLALQVRNPNAPESSSPLVIAAVMPVETRKKKRAVPAADMHFQKPTADDLEACDMAHLEKCTRNNANVTLRKWQEMMTQLDGGNADELNEENACEKFVAFMNGVYEALPNQSLNTFKNTVSHVNTQVMGKIGLNLTTHLTLRRAKNRYVELKKKLTNNAARGDAKVRSTAYSKDQYFEMLETLFDIGYANMTTEEHIQLVDLIISGWTALRTGSKHQLLMKHIPFVADQMSMDKCGFKVVQNFKIHKTELIADSNVDSGDYDTECTLYCQCATHKYCPVMILLQYVESLKEGIGKMMNTFGGSDGILYDDPLFLTVSTAGSWLGNPKAKQLDHLTPAAFGDLYFYRSIKVQTD